MSHVGQQRTTLRAEERRKLKALLVEKKKNIKEIMDLGIEAYKRAKKN